MNTHALARTAIVLTALTLSLAGCTSFEVGAKASITEQSTNGYETVNGSIYGFRWTPYQVQKCEESALARVEVQINGLQLLASLLSLGLYVPQTVEWWCDDSSVIHDEDDPEPDPDDEFGMRRTSPARDRRS
jgi:hypothetical protein